MKKVISAIFAILVITATGYSQKQIPLIGSVAPSFTAKTTDGKLKFPDDYGKSWKILFSHPQDFTPVCSSELLELAYMHDEFKKLGVKVAVISTDDVETHKMWKAHLEELDYKHRGPQKIDFPIIDDTGGKVSRMYGMLHAPISTNKDIRGVFVIDSENIVRAINFYPMQVGRNMDEIVRIVEALKTTNEAKVLTPANWNEGDDVMVPYFPYKKEELVANPKLKDQYYNVGNRLWFKRISAKK